MSKTEVYILKHLKSYVEYTFTQIYIQVGTGFPMHLCRCVNVYMCRCINRNSYRDVYSCNLHSSALPTCLPA